ncbi:NADP-dependent oxidoreductase domain-containing protein [Armillaria fumosa]|nr:NADP-dependent oxidoreductase domain-containing protein [Armillaria fumosa]
MGGYIPCVSLQIPFIFILSPLKHWVKDYQIPHEEIINATKCHRVIEKAMSIQGKLSNHLKKMRDYVNQWELSRAVIFNTVEASLTCLKTNYINLLQIHRYDNLTPLKKTMKALHDLIQSGKVQYISMSTMPAWKLHC